MFAVSKRGKDTPFGAFHGSDVSLWFPNNMTGETFAVDALSISPITSSTKFTKTQ
jgi:hypothetical protein